MNISYKKLWKLLIDRDMKKKDLEKAAGISNYVLSKCSCTVRKQATENKR